VFLIIGLCVGVTSLLAQEPKKEDKKEDPAHEQLRTLRRQLVDAVNKNDLDALLALVDKNVVVTWMNGEVSRGPDGIRAYYDKMMKGDKRIVQSIQINPEVDELTHLYGDTGVAFGSSRDHFKLTDGRDFEILTRWSATLTRADGKWRLANFHASANVFDNPILSIAIKQTALWTGIGAVVVGLVVGVILGRFLRKRPA
jgi:uncharacterized protein (TIGR02246 family)